MSYVSDQIHTFCTYSCLYQVYSIVSALTLLVLLIISLGSSPVLKRIFRGDVMDTDDNKYSNKNLEILTGSNRQLVSTIINDEHIKESLVLLQNLDISREQRRNHNKMSNFCLEPNKQLKL